MSSGFPGKSSARHAVTRILAVVLDKAISQHGDPLAHAVSDL